MLEGFLVLGRVIIYKVDEDTDIASKLNFPQANGIEKAEVFIHLERPACALMTHLPPHGFRESHEVKLVKDEDKMLEQGLL